jgi:hypothetical protein
MSIKMDSSDWTYHRTFTGTLHTACSRASIAGGIAEFKTKDYGTCIRAAIYPTQKICFREIPGIKGGLMSKNTLQRGWTMSG